MQKASKAILPVLICCCSFFIQRCFAQKENFNLDYDSLSRQLPLKTSPEERIRILALLVDRYNEFATQPNDILLGYLSQLIELNKKDHVIDAAPYEAMNKT